MNRSSLSLRSEGISPPLTMGYANVNASSGGPPSGLAIFSLRQGNVLISEATVPLTGLAQEGRIYAEVEGVTNTGIAIANPGTQPATVTFYFTDAAGNDLGHGITGIPARGQIARFLNETPFVGPTSFFGSFTFMSSQPVSVIALRSHINERSEFLMTTLPVAPVFSNETAPIYFPHFADGGGWTSQVVLLNPTANTLTGNVQFLGRQSNTASEYIIPPRTSFVFRTAGSSPTTDSGWVYVTPSGGTVSPSGLLVFTFRRDGIVVSEAGVPSSFPGSAFRLYLESAGNINSGQVGSVQTGVAIANPGGADVTLNFDTTNASGASMGVTGRLTIPAQGQVAAFVNQIPGMDNLLAAQGVLRITATGPVAVMGLRARYNERGDFLITTVEPSNESAPPRRATGTCPISLILTDIRRSSSSTAGSPASPEPGRYGSFHKQDKRLG